MAYSLKTTGLATSLVMCLAVDEDGTTIREFVSTTVDSQKTVDSGVTTGSESWKGTSRYYFTTLANGSYDFYGIRFGTTKPPWQPVDADGCTFWAACASMSAGDGTPPGIFLSDGDVHNIRRLTDSTGALSLYSNYGDRAAGTTALPTGGASFSVGIAYDDADYAAYFGLESGSLASDGSGTSNVGFMGNTSVASIGGGAGYSNCPASWHIVCLFNRKLTLTELQSLHDDWFNVLFDAGGGGGSSLPPGLRSDTPRLDDADLAFALADGGLEIAPLATALYIPTTSGITLTIISNEGNDASSISLIQINNVGLSASENGDISSISLIQINNVVISSNEGNDTSSISVTVGSGITLNISSQEGHDSSLLSLNQINRIVIGPVESSDTGSFQSKVENVLNIAGIEGFDFSSLNAKLSFLINLAPLEANDVSSITIDVAGASPPSDGWYKKWFAVGGRNGFQSNCYMQCRSGEY